MSNPFDRLDKPAAPQPGRVDDGSPVQGASPMRIPELIADVYRGAAAPFRARLLECLLQPIGPLGLVAVAAGAFGAILQRGGYRHLVVAPEDAARITADQMLQLARYVEQCSPQSFQRIAALLAESPAGIAGLGGSLLLLALQAWRQRASGD